MGIAARASRIAVLLACLGAVALASAVSAGAQPRFGLSDYEPRTFSDPRVAQLGVHLARNVVPWNAALNRGDRAQVSEWLTAVKRARGRIVPFITFEHADNNGRAPSPGQYLYAFLKFRKLFPWVKEFSPWDESNHSSQPIARNPHLGAEYYNVLAAHCPGCEVTAPDLLDSDANFESWALEFAHYAHPYPTIWPFNPYTSVSLDDPSRIEQMLRTVRGQIWFSEVGGVVWWKFRGRLIYHGPAYAARIAHYIFDFAALSSRITRIYYYHWRSPGVPGHMPRNARWDAGLVDAHGRARPALWVVAEELRRHIQGTIPKVF
ncbi:MAG TPA: hypothetical protein VHS55_00465 [Solirubrobacteraceae bacterium]|nr:hypothetical protein [Solirubrobacteraceae bacterium]